MLSQKHTHDQWRVYIHCTPHFDYPDYLLFNLQAESTRRNVFRNTISPGAIHDAVQAVGDGEDSAVWKLFADGGLNQVIRLQVNSCRGLIQD